MTRIEKLMEYKKGSWRATNLVIDFNVDSTSDTLVKFDLKYGDVEFQIEGRDVYLSSTEQQILKDVLNYWLEEVDSS